MHHYLHRKEAFCGYYESFTMPLAFNGIKKGHSVIIKLGQEAFAPSKWHLVYTLLWNKQNRKNIRKIIMLNRMRGQNVITLIEAWRGHKGLYESNIWFLLALRDYQVIWKYIYFLHYEMIIVKRQNNMLRILEHKRPKSLKIEMIFDVCHYWHHTFTLSMQL